jgi:hypothetical protein
MRRRSLLLVCAFGIACDSPDARAPGVEAIDTTTPTPAHHFEVDSVSYTLQRDGDAWTASIGYVFRNALRDTIQIVHCNGHIVMDLQKRTNAGWDYVWRGMTNSCLSPAIEIAPGDSLTGRVEVWGAEPGHPNLPTFETADLEGEFRLVWHQPRTHFSAGAPNFGDTLTLARRTTEPFHMRREHAGP